MMDANEIARLCIKPKDDGESVDGFETMKAIADALAAKDATIARLEAELADLKRAMNLRHKDTMKWVDLHTKLESENAALRDLATDAVSALRYIEQTYGKAPGVGWDRVYKKATDAAGYLKPKDAQ